MIVLSDMTEQKQREHDLERQTGHLTALTANGTAAVLQRYIDGAG